MKTQHFFKRLSRLAFLFLLAAALLGSSTACNSKKKLAEKQAAEALAKKTAEAKTKLQELLADNSKTADELERELKILKSKNLQDPEVKAMITQLEGKIAEKRKTEAAAKAENAAREAQEKAKREEEERRKKTVAEKAKTIYNYFDEIMGAGSAAVSNGKIKEALALFSSPTTPVLILIAEEDGEKDYDKPTTADKYLNYLKDQKRQPNKIINIVYDNAGKIKELELSKIK